jgi:hypothetical protein
VPDNLGAAAHAAATLVNVDEVVGVGDGVVVVVVVVGSVVVVVGVVVVVVGVVVVVVGVVVVAAAETVTCTSWFAQPPAVPRHLRV